MSVAPDSVYKPSNDIVAGQIGGETIIVPRVAGIGEMEDESFALNDTGRAIWDHLGGRRSLADVVAALEADYEAPEPGAIERGAIGLVAELLARRMLVAV